MTAYFVTGSGTGVGKSFTTCALLHAAKGARGYKPIVSGFTSGECDTTQIIEAMGSGTIDEVSPWRFAAPLSPDMASRLEDKRLERDALVAWTNEVARQKGLVLIETVGGLMVPINEKHTTRDWVAACKLPLIMVTGSYLGALSHTLATVEAARAVKLNIKALVINESACNSVGVEETKRSLAPHLGDISLILAQPRVSSPKEATVISSLAAHL